MLPANKTKLFVILGVVLLVAVGIAAGYFLAKSPATSLTSSTSSTGAKNSSGGPVVGTTDTKTFSDNATGTLLEGGLSGEGTHHLERPGGVSQTVYLVSSIVDLSEFVGKKVEVGGQTIDAQHVGWLMDVGRVKIVE